MIYQDISFFCPFNDMCTKAEVDNKLGSDAEITVIPCLLFMKMLKRVDESVRVDTHKINCVYCNPTDPL